MDRSLFTLSGAVWMNLLNTKVMVNKQPTDLLLDREITTLWLEANQLGTSGGVPLSLSPSSFEQLQAELISIRELCERILADFEQLGMLGDQLFDELNIRLKKLNVHPVIERDQEKVNLLYYGNHWIDHVVYKILHSIFDTLNMVTPDRIRKCEHDECILRFVDTSKSGRRRWCSMELCGNRHKAAQFYEKQKKRKA